MKTQSLQNLKISSVLAFALIPLGGFATDIYLPSLPAMAKDLGVSVQAVQLSLLLFMVSSGFSQLFIGGILDAYGRYRISISALIIFILASFSIALIPNIYVIYVMRVLQGVAVSMVIVGKRAFFVDMFTGEKLKNYTSLFSIVWATAPILAPFLGGYLQQAFGWQSNFWFLGIAALVLLLLELRFSGESLKKFTQFNWTNISSIYGKILRTGDFSVGLLIIGITYSFLVIYGMVSPFVIERVYHQTAVVTGYSSLLSGVALMSGGILSKILIDMPLAKKLGSAVALQVLTVAAMAVTLGFTENVYLLIALTLPIHLLSGFMFNTVYAYCLRRFTEFAGTASGLTGGGIYVISSFVGYGLINTFDIKTAQALSWVNIGLVVVVLAAVLTFLKLVGPSKIQKEQKLQQTLQTNMQS